ncbi:hypothetical protein [Methanobrevibacter sp.]
MDGVIDLESYTISIIRINNALSKLKDNRIDEVKELFDESFVDLQQLYLDIVDDLNRQEVNLNEYYLFFQNGKQAFPQYIEVLQNIDITELDESAGSLANVFKNLNKIAAAFNEE